MKLQRLVSGIASSLSAAALLTFAPASAMAADYVMSASADFTGPFADVAPSTVSGIRAVAAWWNDTKGKELGTNVDIKVHDMRYDASVVASTWPSILATDKPIMHLGFGTPDLITLMKRLPGDKVPMLMSTAMVGLVWKPNGWHFSFRPTYSHEFVGLLNHLQQKKGGKLTIGAISYADRGGICRSGQRRTEIRRDQSRPFHRSRRAVGGRKPGICRQRSANAGAAAARRHPGRRHDSASGRHRKGAARTGRQHPDHHVDPQRTEGSGQRHRPEGDRRLLFGFRFYARQPGGPAGSRPLYEVSYTGAGNWGIAAAQSSYQALLALRVLEQAIAKGGKDAVTGQAMYDAMLGADYSEASLMGSLPDIKFDTTAPFPVGKLKVKAQVVRDGKIATLGNDWLPVPDLPKW
jgi:hypothetical protein